MSRFGQGRSSATVYARAVAFYLNFGLLFKYAGQNCNIESVRVCVTQGRQAGMQDNFDDLLIHIGSKAKKKSKKATLLRGWTMVQWSVRRAEEQMRCGWRGDLGMWVDCRADEGSGNRCVVECCSQGTWTGGKVPKVAHVFCVQLFCMLIYR